MTLLCKEAQVSVIIPCYRCAKTIDRAVASIVSQTLKPAQVVLVDDGSGDETIHKLQEIKRRYSENWISVVFLEHNAGPAVARNAGWSAATQPYIAFLDADDDWHPRKLEIQYSWMLDHPEVALTGHVHTQLDGIWPSLPDNFRTQQIGPYRLLLSNILPTPSVMLWRNIPFRFDPAKRYSEDYLLWLQVIMSGNMVYLIDLPLARMHKSAYGEAGLSGNLWAMEKEELKNYKRFSDERMISKLMYAILVSFSLVKFFRRVFKKRAIC